MSKQVYLQYNDQCLHIVLKLKRYHPLGTLKFQEFGDRNRGLLSYFREMKHLASSTLLHWSHHYLP